MYTFLPFLGGALQDMENNGFRVLERIRKLPSPRQVPLRLVSGLAKIRALLRMCVRNVLVQPSILP